MILPTTNVVLCIHSFRFVYTQKTLATFTSRDPCILGAGNQKPAGYYGASFGEFLYCDMQTHCQVTAV